MEKPTLILPPRYSDDSNALWRAALKLGWPIERLQSWRVPDDVRPQSVAIYGESLRATFVAEQLSMPLYEPPFEWLTLLPSQFVGRKIEFLTLGEARDKVFPLFVKPAGEKTFEARVYQSANDLDFGKIWPDSTPVLISDPVIWEVEYRYFVLNRQVKTASSYWRGDSSTQDENGAYISPPDELRAAVEFTNKLLKKKKPYSLLPFCGAVVDVGLLRGFGWAVIEANPAFASGIYGCDPEAVLEVIAACPYQVRG